VAREAIYASEWSKPKGEDIVANEWSKPKREAIVIGVHLPSLSFFDVILSVNPRWCDSVSHLAGGDILFWQ